MKNAFPRGAHDREAQRFYARNDGNTTLDPAAAPLMQSFRAPSAKLPSRTGILLKLAAFADDVAGTFACLFAYMGTLALLAILGLYGLSQIPATGVPERAAPDWVTATETPRLRGTL